MWRKSAVNFSFFLSFATFRMRSSACDTLTRHCVRRVLCWRAFPLVPALRSTGSAALGSATDRSAMDSSALFAGFVATMAGSDFSCRASSATAPRLPDADRRTLYSPHDCGGQTRDLPASDAIHLRVMCSLTPAERQHLA